MTFSSTEMNELWFSFAGLEGVSVRHLYFTLIAATATLNPFALLTEAVKLIKAKGLENESYLSSPTNRYDQVGHLLSLC